MMNSLIQITKNTINGAEVNSVNAREIHSYLKVNTKFADWIKRAIEKYDFIENIDFSILRNGNPNGGRDILDYIVTLEMGKELAMLENNPKGKEIRKQFIDFELKGKSLIQQQSKEIQLLQGMLNTISKMDSRVTELEQTRRLENWQEKELLDLKNKKVYELAEKHDFKNDESMIKKLHSRIWRAFKIRFNIPRYNELPCLKFEDGKAFINRLTIGDVL